jgi:hypothetical protein
MRGAYRRTVVAFSFEGPNISFVLGLIHCGSRSPDTPTQAGRVAVIEDLCADRLTLGSVTASFRLGLSANCREYPNGRGFYSHRTRWLHVAWNSESHTSRRGAQRQASQQGHWAGRCAEEPCTQYPMVPASESVRPSFSPARDLLRRYLVRPDLSYAVWKIVLSRVRLKSQRLRFAFLIRRTIVAAVIPCIDCRSNRSPG